MTEPDPIAEIQNQTIPEIVEQMPAMTDAELAHLRELEDAAKTPRAGLISEIDAETARRSPAGGDKSAKDDKAAKADKAPKASKAAQTTDADKAKAEADAKANAWRAADYTGPLTADQAEWRNANIKPVQVARTK